MKIGVADYGMNVWYGGCFDAIERLTSLKAIGYEGIEVLRASDASEAMRKATEFRKLRMDFGLCVGPDSEATIRWTAALAKRYIWADVGAKDFDRFCRQVNEQVRIADHYGVCVGIHNHLNTPVETQPQLEEFLSRCPDCGIVLDTGHLAAAGGDCVAIVKKYWRRLLAMHVKDWRDTTGKSPVNNPKWYECGYFTTLGLGNISQNNGAALRTAVDCGYDGWIFVEHDTHKQEPLVDLKLSREYLKTFGF